MSTEEARFKADVEDTFNMQVVDINRTTKGMKSGGIVRYGSLVVVGNNNVRPGPMQACGCGFFACVCGV